MFYVITIIKYIIKECNLKKDIIKLVIISKTTLNQKSFKHLNLKLFVLIIINQITLPTFYI